MRREGGGLGALPAGVTVLLVVICALWGLNMVAIEISNVGVPSVYAVVLRNAVAAAVIGAWTLLRREPLFQWDRRGVHGIALGVLFGLDFFFLYWGTSFTTASRGIVFLYTYPFWVALGAHLFLPGDRLTMRGAIGLLLAFGGIGSVFLAGADGGEAAGAGGLYWVGDIMEVVSALFWAATTLYIKVLVGHYEIPPATTLFYQLAFSVPVLVLAALALEGVTPVAIDWKVGGSLFFQAVIVASASYLLWYWLIQKYRVSVLASFIMLVPIFGVLGGGVVLGEPVGARLLFGAVLVAIGIGLVTSVRRDAATQGL